MMSPQKVEELLETVFTEREEGRDDAASIVAHTFAGHAPGKSVSDLAELAQLGLVALDGPRVRLTAAGESRAQTLVRRHRLSERFFGEVLGLAEPAAEREACELEHVLSPEATDSVCALLGHPQRCPHGKPIPRGDCCTRPSAPGEEVMALEHAPLGQPLRLAFVASRTAGRVERLLRLGLSPGSELRLCQRAPAYVLEAGETTVALDRQIAREVFVRRA
jgi:DtxR family Mn-dependent transcriptional regulator